MVSGNGYQCLHGILSSCQPDFFPAVSMGLLPSLLRSPGTPSHCLTLCQRQFPRAGIRQRDSKCLAQAEDELHSLLLRPSCVPVLTTGLKLWCWIGDSWNSLRIFTYYIPIWVCIMLSTFIYFAVGYQVFHQRNQLRNLTLSNVAKDTSTSDVRESGERVCQHLPMHL